MDMIQSKRHRIIVQETVTMLHYQSVFLHHPPRSNIRLQRNVETNPNNEVYSVV
jgi:hypothetical protein